MSNPPNRHVPGDFDPAQAEALGQVPILYRNVFQRAYLAVASKRDAIKANCLECIGFERKQVTNCTARSRPLWAYRPYQTDDEVQP